MPPSHQASNPGDVMALQDPQTGPSNPLPCAHWSLKAASEVSSPLIVTEGLSGAWGQCIAGLTHAHRGAARTSHHSCSRASPKSAHPLAAPTGPLGKEMMLFVPWWPGVPVRRGLCA